MSRCFLAIVTTFALTAAAGAAPARFVVTSTDASWDGDPHGRPWSTVTLSGTDGSVVWRVAGVVSSHVSGDGRLAALVTRDHRLLVSRVPEPPRLVGGSYLSARCADDGSLVAAHEIGREGDTLLRTLGGRGIAIVDPRTLEARLVLVGADLYAPSFADGRRLFFGSGGPERLASLWLLDLDASTVARITNVGAGALEPFPEAPPRLEGASVRYVAQGREVVAALPPSEAFVPAPRFDAPAPALVPDPSDFGAVRFRTPTTNACSLGGANVGQYFDLDRRMGLRADWACGLWTYDGHRGTDFCQPCGQPVAAPASGYVIEWYDGCPNFGNWGNGCGYGWGNHVAIVHDDWTVSLEAHGMAGTVVRAGPVACGATLMLSCSSGNSTGPHIHHENWIDQSGRWDPRKAFDPYRGSCDPLDPSKWRSQGAYKALPGASCN